jgi:ATP-dependent 26S proteasome regulatory subunit
MKSKKSAKKAKSPSNQTGSGNELILKDMDILDHIEKIVEISQKIGIERCLSEGKRHLDYVTEKLDINPLQALLFSHFMEKSSENHILISEIAESIQCSKVRIIKYINECEELEKKKLIRCSRDSSGISFRIPADVRDSIRKFNEFRPEKNENLTIDKFFTVLERLFEERSNNELTFEALNAELLDLIKLNMHLEFCKKIMSYNLGESSLTLLLCFCHLYGNNNDDNIGMHDLDFLYEDKSYIKVIQRELTNGDHTLIDSKFIEYNNNNGFVNSDSWKLSDKSKKELLCELSIKENKSYKKNLIHFDAIKPKKMFYNTIETDAIQKVISLLSEDNYRKILDRLDEKGMRKGFACLFSGGPGTGKTETAYQIARETKRNIMQVDIADTKSMWYGESEKKIKEIFESYRAAVDKSDIAPILLFNEADAVIGKRKEIGGTNRSIDQTENTIQNIILQEMENLSGIMIATTNLTTNMDKAFERRFLYKINFDKPCIESRRGIWNALLPDLPESNVVELGGKFELSGGQIENITRKIEVDAILSGNILSMDTLTQYCKDEIQNNFSGSKKIGFGSE